MKNSKFLALCLSLVCAFVLAGVLATTALAAPVTYYVGSADFEYQGDTHTPDYATISEALAAVGTNGGTIIFTGEHDYVDTDLDKTRGAPYLTFLGADSTAKLKLKQNKTYYHQTKATYDNLTLQPASSQSAPLLAGFSGSGHSITFGENLTFNTNGNSQVVIAGNAGWGAANDLVFNGGNFSSVRIGGIFGNASAGSNTHVTVNGGTMPSTLIMGAAKVIAGTFNYTHNGNITFTLNGGTYNATTQYVQLNQSGSVATTTNVVGKTSLIINNDLASTYNFVTSDIDYVLKSTADGIVELETEGSADTAPTFRLSSMVDKSYVVYVNGTPIETTNGIALFTPEAAGTYNITYGPAPTATLYSLTYSSNGGSGFQTGSSAEEGEEITLPTTTTFTNPGKFFAGWGATADATSPVATPFYMPASDTTLYAIWYDSVYANSDGSGKITIGTNEYIAYTSITDALAALGNAGGKIIFTGNYALANIVSGTKAAAPGYTFVGTDVETAKLTLTSSWYNFTTDMAFENLTLEAPANGYIMLGTAGNKTVTYGGPNDTNPVVVATSTGGAVAQLGAMACKGWAPGGTLVINSGTYNFVAGSPNAPVNAGGNINIILNGGTFATNKIVGGAGGLNPSGTKNINGNITVTINGGNFQATTNVLVSGDAAKGAISNVTGKTSVIINNGLAETINFVTDEYDYTLKSTTDGFVELTTEATDTTAPTFTITAKDAASPVFINGTEIEAIDGVATFTPESNGVYNITYGPEAPAIVAFTDVKANGAGYVADTADANEKTYAIIASVQISDDIDVADITGFGFYGYVADTDTVVVNQTTATIIGTLTANNKKYYTLIYDIPTIDTEVILKPFVTAAGVTYAGTATSYVPSTIGADTYYGPKSAIENYFTY